MKMRSIWESKTYLKNATRLLTFWYILERDFETFHKGNIGSEGRRSTKLLPLKSWSSEEKVCCFRINYSQSVCKSVCIGLIPPRIESFSKFDVRELCSPLKQRPYIHCMEISKPPLKSCEKFKRLARFQGWNLLSQSDHIFIGLI